MLQFTDPKKLSNKDAGSGRGRETHESHCEGEIDLTSQMDGDGGGPGNRRVQGASPGKDNWDCQRPGASLG